MLATQLNPKAILDNWPCQISSMYGRVCGRTKRLVQGHFGLTMGCPGLTSNRFLLEAAVTAKYREFVQPKTWMLKWFCTNAYFSENPLLSSKIQSVSKMFQRMYVPYIHMRVGLYIQMPIGVYIYIYIILSYTHTYIYIYIHNFKSHALCGAWWLLLGSIFNMI